MCVIPGWIFTPSSVCVMCHPEWHADLWLSSSSLRDASCELRFQTPPGFGGFIRYSAHACSWDWYRKHLQSHLIGGLAVSPGWVLGRPTTWSCPQQLIARRYHHEGQPSGWSPSSCWVEWLWRWPTISMFPWVLAVEGSRSLQAMAGRSAWVHEEPGRTTSMTAGFCFRPNRPIPFLYALGFF